MKTKIVKFIIIKIIIIAISNTSWKRFLNYVYERPNLGIYKD